MNIRPARACPYPAPSQEPFRSTKFTVMWYKRYGCIGIRERGGGPQIMSFGAGTNLAESVQRAWATKVLQRLETQPPEEVKVWIGKELAVYRK